MSRGTTVKARIEAVHELHGDDDEPPVHWFAGLLGRTPQCVYHWTNGHVDLPQYAETVLRLLELLPPRANLSAAMERSRVTVAGRRGRVQFDPSAPAFFRDAAPVLKHARTELEHRKKAYQRRFEPSAANEVRETIEGLEELLVMIGAAA